MFRRTAAALTALAALTTLSACAPNKPARTNAAETTSAGARSGQPSTVLDRLGVRDSDGTAIIAALEASTEKRPLDIKASVKSDRLVLTENGRERSLPLPTDRFYLSLAPYVTTTHDCFAHSLSGCQGELAGKTVHVTITDSAGKSLVDRDVALHSNGFAGFWLPARITGRIAVTMDGKSGEVPFATNADSPTCVTTLQLR